jgi:hypothetical protein
MTNKGIGNDKNNSRFPSEMTNTATENKAARANTKADSSASAAE